MGESGGSALLDAGLESGAKKAGEGIVSRALDAVTEFVKKQYGKKQVQIGSAFERYLENAKRRYNQVRTLATGTEPRSIIGPDSIYVEIGVRHKKQRIDTATVDPMLSVSKNLLILGTGGIGKSMLMRYLFLNTAIRGEYVPVLLELRRVSGQPAGRISILDLIYSCMEEFDVQLPKEQFEYSLRLGKYLFLFDGFDEVKEALAAETAAAIQAFSAKYPDNPCIVTSRPGRNASPLETFTILDSMMLSKSQAVELASKIWTEDEKTREFCHQLEDSLYDRHQDFAENPLLLSMMFLTFMRNSSIPDHLADFYQKAYDALYSAHDNQDKGVYRRDFRCKTLDENKFKLLFSHFCFQSYFKEEYEFSEEEIVSYLQKSIKKHGLREISASDYLLDLRNVVCMIIKDGDIYRFSHRSFQAYFAAYYTSNVLTDEKQKQLFLSVLSDGSIFWKRDDYYRLLAQIEPERFTENALEEGLRDLQQKLIASPDPNILLLKSEAYGVEVGASEDGGEMLYYSLNEGQDSRYFLNVIWLFQKYVKASFVSKRDSPGYASQIGLVKKYIMRRSQEDTNEAAEHSLMLFRELDSADCITEEERRQLYLTLIWLDGTSELRASIDSWLAGLDAKRAALKSPNFIEDL